VAKNASCFAQRAHTLGAFRQVVQRTHQQYDILRALCLSESAGVAKHGLETVPGPRRSLTRLFDVERDRVD
jgi:hypothetical protein